MKYALMIYVSPGGMEAFSEEEGAAISAEYLALRGDPRCVDGA